jgi:hypothetical protein
MTNVQAKVNDCCEGFTWTDTTSTGWIFEYCINTQLAVRVICNFQQPDNQWQFNLQEFWNQLAGFYAETFMSCPGTKCGDSLCAHAGGIDSLLVPTCWSPGSGEGPYGWCDTVACPVHVIYGCGCEARTEWDNDRKEWVIVEYCTIPEVMLGAAPPEPINCEYPENCPVSDACQGGGQVP